MHRQLHSEQQTQGPQSPQPMILPTWEALEPQSHRQAMEPGKDRSIGWPNRGRWRRAAPGLCLWLLAGCACAQQQFDRALLACRADQAGTRSAGDRYTVACPDVLEWTVDART